MNQEPLMRLKEWKWLTEREKEDDRERESEYIQKKRKRKRKWKKKSATNKNHIQIIVWAVFFLFFFSNWLCIHCAYARMNICIHTFTSEVSAYKPNVLKWFRCVWFLFSWILLLFHRFSNVPFFHLLFTFKKKTTTTTHPDYGINGRVCAHAR